MKLRWLAGEAEAGAGRRALDIGAGRAFYAAELARRGWRVLALDRADLRAAPVGTASAPFVLGVAARLPFRDRAFALVLAFDVIEHCEDDEAAVAEMARVAGGRVILSVPRRHPEVLGRYNLTFKHHTDKTHRREYDPDGLRALLERHGLTVRRIQPEGPVSPALAAEFLPWGRVPVRRAIHLTVRLGWLRNDDLCADLYVLAERP
ncbi:MAG: class I SAM-dependent methyltransferase [Planctomycetes bacterium]|nr:class I SAM-dependent methyltransferase [Planctomycetota bacterium]